jgi:hypothetical protein
MARKMQRVCSKSANREERTLTFAFADGTSVVVNVDDFTPEMREHSMFHGFLQKFGDSYASATSVKEAKERLSVVIGQVKNEEWNRRGGGGGTGAGIWALAIARVTGQDVEAVQELWEKLDDKQRKATRADPRVKKAKLEIELERMPGGGEEEEPVDFGTLTGLGILPTDEE